MKNTTNKPVHCPTTTMPTVREKEPEAWAILRLIEEELEMGDVKQNDLIGRLCSVLHPGTPRPPSVAEGGDVALLTRMNAIYHSLRNRRELLVDVLDRLVI